MTCVRILLDEEPFAPQNDKSFYEQGRWPDCSWIGLGTPPKLATANAVLGGDGLATCETADTPLGRTIAPIPPSGQYVAAYRHRFTLDQARKYRIHVSGDERYELYIDGEMVGRGPERCDADHWAVASYDLDLAAGPHVISAQVYTLGDRSAFAQHSVRHGFLLASNDGSLNTGKAEWESILAPGYEFIDPDQAWGTGSNLRMHGDQLRPELARGQGEGWYPAIRTNPAVISGYPSELGPCLLLIRSKLPPMFEDRIKGMRVRHSEPVPAGDTNGIVVKAANHHADLAAGMQSLLDGKAPLTIPPHTRVRHIVDMGNYYCARTDLATSGGAGSAVRIHWQEALFENNERMTKGNRAEIEGKRFAVIWNWHDGIGDTYLPGDGKCEFTPFWWQAGVFTEIVIQTGDKPLTIDRLGFVEEHYPHRNESEFTASDETLAPIVPIGWRTLQMCSHETYMDCPFYEQLQYAGDTRLQALVTYVGSRDDRLPRQALRAFDYSRRIEGLTMSRYPSRVRQVIPPFSLWFVCMVGDHYDWRGDLAVIREHWAAIRSVMDHFGRHVDASGRLHQPPGWNFMDWVPSWPHGAPEGATLEPKAPHSLQYLLALQAAAKMAEALKETELASRYHRLGHDMLVSIDRTFRGRDGRLYDDPGHTQISEHTPALAILAGIPNVTMPKGDEKGLAMATIYFSHYVFEAYRRTGEIDRLLGRLDLWRWHLTNGLHTTIEMPEPTRSDCHAWGAHPIFHFHASVAGIRPEMPGMETLRISPQLGSLTWAESRIPHPRGGSVWVRVDRDGSHLKIQTDSPVPAIVESRGESHQVAPGRHAVRLPG